MTYDRARDVLSAALMLALAAKEEFGEFSMQYISAKRRLDQARENYANVISPNGRIPLGRWAA